MRSMARRSSRTPTRAAALALIAARFFGAQPEVAVAVTGTNGKTSVASFVRQLWEQMGFRAASLGTVGVVGPSGTQTLAHTTPDPIELHRILADLASLASPILRSKLRAMGSSSAASTACGLRPGPSPTSPATISTITSSFEDYFNVKLRLFAELLPQGAGAVIDVDSNAGEQVAALAKSRGLSVFSVGRAGEILAAHLCRAGRLRPAPRGRA